MDQNLKIVIETVNQEALKKLQQDIDRDTQAINALSTAMNNGKISGDQFGKQALVLGQNIADTRDQMKQLEAASGHAGRGLGQLAYAVDDLQYGFNAIVNNIPQIIMGLGGGAGIAGAVGIAAVAINQLIKHWDELSAKLEANWSGGSAEQLLKLKERAEDAAKAFEKLKDASTHIQEVATGTAGKAIIEQGAEDLAKRIADLMISTGTGATKRDARITRGSSPQQVDKLLSEQIQMIETHAMAKNLLGQSQAPGIAGELARQQLGTMIKEHPSVFPPGFRAGIQGAQPDAVKAQEAFEKRLEAQKKVEADIKKNTDEHTKKAVAQADHEHQLAKEIEHDREKRNKEVEELNKQGDHFRQMQLQDQKKERIEDLQDKRELILEQTHRQLELLRTDRKPQILQGAKAAIDLYQTAGGNARADAAHKIREQSRNYLKSIDEQLKKEHRLVIQR